MDEETIEIKPVTKEMLDEYINIHNKLLPVQYPQKWYEQFFSGDNRIALAAIDNTINLDENQNLHSELIVNNWCVHLVKNIRVKICTIHGNTITIKDRYGEQEQCERNVLAPIKSRIIGFASGRIDKYDATSICDYLCCRRHEGQRGYIMSLGCLKSHRRRGIGTYMLDALMKILSTIGCDSFSLHCTVKNAAAIQLYERHGFETVGFLREYYHFHGKFHDAYHLVLENSMEENNNNNNNDNNMKKNTTNNRNNNPQQQQHNLNNRGGMQLVPTNDDVDIRYRKNS